MRVKHCECVKQQTTSFIHSFIHSTPFQCCRSGESFADRLKNKDLFRKYIFVTLEFLSVMPERERERKKESFFPCSCVYAFNPFSTGTQFHIHSAYYLSILYSFRNSCGNCNSTDSGHYSSNLLMSIKSSNGTQT